MKQCRNITLSCLALIVVGTLSGQAFATNAAVGLCAAPGTHYTTIGAAVSAVAPGTKISVCPGTYAEQVNITTSLTLAGIASGNGDAPTVVPPSGGIVQNGTDIFGNPVAAQIFVSGATVTISGLTVDATGNNQVGCGAPTLEGIYFQNSNGSIIHNVVRNQYQTDFVDYGGCQNGLAINVESPNNGNTVTISDNSVRAYQKNGITGTGSAMGNGSGGPTVTITGNYIVGLAATSMNWPGGAAENGVQVGFGAKGSISSNIVNDNIWFNDNSGDPGDAASGILVYSSPGITITGNSVGSAQFGITTDTSDYGPADNTTITSNKVSGTQIFDAIDLCSNGNTAKSNTIYGNTESGVHVDDSCGSANNNSVTLNTINEACVGVLLGTGTGTTSSPNTYFNVTNKTLLGDVCPATPGPRAKSKKLRPSPYMPHRK
jgi:Right handed beta helix region